MTNIPEVDCKYRRGGVNCSAADIMVGNCKTCGWNPEVEERRKEKIYQEHGWREKPKK